VSAGTVIPRVYEWKSEDPKLGLGYTFGVGFILCTLSELCMVTLAILDYKMHKNDDALLKKMRLEAAQSTVVESVVASDTKETAKCFSPRDIRKFSAIFWLFNITIMCTSQATTNST
jgi:hypothetical protein